MKAARMLLMAHLDNLAVEICSHARANVWQTVKGGDGKAV